MKSDELSKCVTKLILLVFIGLVFSNEIYASELDLNSKQQALDVETQACPKQFFDLQLPENGKLCQLFDKELPASMIFFVPQSPSKVAEFFTQTSNLFENSTQIKSRLVLQSNDKNITLIVSEDGKGSQVDVLIKENSLSLSAL